MAIKIYECGTPVKTLSGQIDAIITAAIVRFDKIGYEIGYFANGEYLTAWLNEKELIISPDAKTTKVGYK